MAYTWYVTNTILNSTHQEMSETSPGSDATSSPNYGWTVGTTAPTVYASADAGSMVAAASFGATVQPDGSIVTTSNAGDCWRTTNAYTGTFATGTWTFQAAVMGTAGGVQRGRMGFRLFRSANTNGSSATEITSGRLAGGIIAGDPVTAQRTSVHNSTSISSFSLSGEYLFVQVGWEITTAGPMTTANIITRVGTTASLVTSTNISRTSSLPKSGSHVVSLTKAITRSLSDSGGHNATLSKALTLTSSLSDSGSHSVSLSQILARVVSLTKPGSHTATLSKLVTAFRSLGPVGSHTALLSKVMSALRALSGSGSHSVSLSKASGHSNDLPATGSHSATISKLLSALKSLGVSAGGVLSLALQVAYGKSLNAIGGHLVNLEFIAGGAVNLNAAGSHLSSLSRQLDALRSLLGVGGHQVAIDVDVDLAGNNYPQPLSAFGGHVAALAYARVYSRNLSVVGHHTLPVFRPRGILKREIGRPLSERPYTAALLELFRRIHGGG